MATTTKYVRQQDGNWYVGTGRVQLYGVIAQWQQGYSPEEIQVSFPSLTLAEVYGSVLYYLEHQETLDASFREQDELFARLKAQHEAQHAEFHSELRQRIAQWRARQRTIAS
jgi:uncharacterized protein (DUF433 family)